MNIYSKDLFHKLPECILFDADNTLFSYEAPHKKSLEAVKRKTIKELSVQPDDFDKAFYEARLKVKERLIGTAASHNRLLYMQKMLELMGLGSQVLIALDLEQTYWRVFMQEAELFEGVRGFIDDIRLMSIPIVLITDLTAQIQFRKMVYFGLDQYFDSIVTSEEAGFDKPNKTPFLIALEKIGFSGNRIWMIGDNPLNDIKGSKEALGAITLQKLHQGVNKGEGLEKPDLDFNEFSELRSLLKNLMKE